jgi:hypothetical protein
MPQVVVQELLCLVSRADTAERCHDSGIMMHPAKLGQPLDTQAFSNQTIRAKGEY